MLLPLDMETTLLTPNKKEVTKEMLLDSMSLIYA